MGAWNRTCGITNLPIREGDKVTGFLISTLRSLDEDYGEFCGVGIPLTMPFFGEYDGYGGVADLEPSFVVDDIQTKFGKKGEKLDDLIERIADSKISVDSQHGVGLWLVHRDIYDKLSSIDHKISGDTTMSQYQRERLNKILNDKDSREYMLEKLFSFGEFARDETIHDPRVLVENFDLAIDMFNFYKSMLKLRRSFIPQGCAGSSDDSFKLAKLLAKETIALINKFHREAKDNGYVSQGFTKI